MEAVSSFGLGAIAPWDLVLRLCSAAAAGLAVGLDRELRGKPAGLRTLALVSLAAALFTILTFEIFVQASALSDELQADPIRVIEAVVTGVAFLGAGTIIQARQKVVGVTTGAAVWMVGAIGVACGAGRFGIALLATVLTLFVLVLLGLFERWLIKSKESSEAEPV